MTARTLAPLLVAWCVLVIAPGVVTVFVLGVTDAETGMGGSVAATWMVGYLVQFALWFVISRKSNGTNMLGWFVASLAPWLGCFAGPISAWWLLACGAAVTGYAAWFYRSFVRGQRLQRNGVAAVGTVLEVVRPAMNVVVNNVYLRRTLRLNIRRADGAPPYEAKYTGTFMLGAVPEAGWRLDLRVDPDDPKHLAVQDDTGSTPRRRRRTGGAPREGIGIADQLQRLAALHRDGELTDDEYGAAKRRVIGD